MLGWQEGLLKMAKVPATRPELGQENKGPSRNLRPPPWAPVDQWDPDEQVGYPNKGNLPKDP